MRGAVVAAALLAGSVALPAAARAESAGYQVGSAAATLVYAPAKIVYAATGLLFGGISWAMSGGDREVARAVIDPAVRGDYVVTPQHLRRQRSLSFVGRSQPPLPAIVEEAEPVYREYPYPDDRAEGYVSDYRY